MKNSERRTSPRWLPKSLELFFIPNVFKRLRPKFILNDVFAGVTVGIVALPLAMAFAIASGVSPAQGLFTAIIGGFLISVLSGSKYQIGGPTGAFVIIIYGIIVRHGYQGLVAATILAGIFLIIFGLMRLGTYIKYIPQPVTTGFTTGIAVLIFSTQINDFFGLNIKKVPSEFIEKWESYIHHINAINSVVLIIGVITVATIITIRKIYPRIPAHFVAIFLVCIITWYLGLDIDTIGSKFGGIPSKLPHFAIPDGLSIKLFRAVLPDAITIALLAAIESLLCAVVADAMTGDKHYSNTELVGQGVANLGSVFFGGIPATAAIARTATSIKAGAKTPLAGVIHVAVIVLFVMFLAPLASYIPLAGLAGVLFVVSWDMSELHVFKRMFKAPKSDLVVMLITFLLTVVSDLTVAVQFGMVFAALLFMKRMSDVTSVQANKKLFTDENSLPEDLDPEATANKKIPAGVSVYEINGPLFFGVADKFNDEMNRFSLAPKVFIIRMRNVPAMDSTAAFALESFVKNATKRGSKVILSEIATQPHKVIRKMGIEKFVGKNNIAPSFDEAIKISKLN
jgi:sulfate permease, SulP family